MGAGFSLSASHDAADIATPGVRPQPLVLLADPDADTRGLYAEYLQPRGFTIAHAENGPEALAKAMASRPSVLVTETRLPLISGYELCRLIRGDVATRHITLLIVAGDVRAKDRALLTPALADAVLVKPCLPETLLDEICRPRQASGAPEVAEPPATEGRYGLSRRHTRVTTTHPPTAPTLLICPDCDRPLRYRRTHIGGISAKQSERWDDYGCESGCGGFEYRHRTRSLRRLL